MQRPLTAHEARAILASFRRGITGYSNDSSDPASAHAGKKDAGIGLLISPLEGTFNTPIWLDYIVSIGTKGSRDCCVCVAGHDPSLTLHNRVRKS